MQQYWVKERGPYRFMPAAEMAQAFRASSMGQAAAEELAQPPQRTKQGARQSIEQNACDTGRACLPSGKPLLGVGLSALSSTAVAGVQLCKSFAQRCHMLHLPADQAFS